MPQEYIYADGTVTPAPRQPGEVNSGYLDSVYGLPPIGSDENPMNMEAMRLDEDIGSEHVPLNMAATDFNDVNELVPAEGSDQYPMVFPPEDLRVEKVAQGDGGFVTRKPRQFGPPADAAPGGSPAPASRSIAGKGTAPARGAGMGPPPGVVPPRAAGEEGWDEYVEKPTTRTAGVQVDAISGGEVPRAAAGEGEPDLSWATGRAVMTDEDEMRRQAGMSPRERILDSSNREFRRQQIGIDGMAAAAAKARTDAEDNLRALTQAQLDTKREIDEIRKRPGWWESRSTGQKIAVFASAAFSGMLAAFQGHNKNAAIEHMHQLIEEEAESRAQEMAAERAELADAQDLFKFKELARIRAYEDAKQHVLIQMQKYDPRGSMVAQGMAQIQDFDARMAEAAQKVLEHNWKKNHELLKIASEERMKQADLAQQERASRRAAGVSSQNAKISAGWVMGPDGKLIPPPQNTLKAAGEEANSKWEIARAQAEADKVNRDQRADQIIDPKSRSVLGKPKDYEKRHEIQSSVEAHSILRQDLQHLIDFIKTEGTAGKLTAKRAQVEALRYKVQATVAKIIDPVGAVSDSSIMAADKIVPDADGWIKKWQHPEEVYKTVVDQADREIETKASDRILDYKPGTLTNQYKAIDQQIFAPPPTREDRIGGEVERLYGPRPVGTYGEEAGVEPDAPPTPAEDDDPWKDRFR
jgi:hypothetical protein